MTPLFFYSAVTWIAIEKTVFFKPFLGKGGDRLDRVNDNRHNELLICTHFLVETHVDSNMRDFKTFQSLLCILQKSLIFHMLCFNYFAVITPHSTRNQYHLSLKEFGTFIFVNCYKNYFYSYFSVVIFKRNLITT